MKKRSNLPDDCNCCARSKGRQALLRIALRAQNRVVAAVESIGLMTGAPARTNQLPPAPAWRSVRRDAPRCRVIRSQYCNRREWMDAPVSARDATPFQPVMQCAQSSLLPPHRIWARRLKSLAQSERNERSGRRGASCSALLGLKSGVVRLAAQQLKIAGLVRVHLPKLLQSR
jgi:hypothetical protein